MFQEGEGTQKARRYAFGYSLQSEADVHVAEQHKTLTPVIIRLLIIFSSFLYFYFFSCQSVQSQSLVLLLHVLSTDCYICHLAHVQATKIEVEHAQDVCCLC